MKILRVQDLSYSIGRKKILQTVNFDLEEKEAVVVRGDNGAGKSTLLKCILHHTQYKKWILWEKSILSSGNILSYLGHDLGLYGSLSLEENLRFFHSLGKSSYPWEKIEDWVERLNLHRRWSDPLFKFSRGMKQKAAIIRAFCSKPKLLLLDEPFTGLDEKSYSIVMSLLDEVKKDMAILGVVHGMEHSFWNRTLHLESGKLA